jgi:hypothetical protein
MSATTKITGAIRSKSVWLKETGRSFLSAILTGVLVIVLIVGWKHYHNKHTNTKRPAPATVAQIENADQKTVTGFLNSGNVEEYQASQVFLAIRYYDNQDYVNAERVMNELFTRVPANKINSTSYTLMASIEKAKPDKVLYKKYLELSVSKLKAEGNTAQAAIYQKELDGQ